MIYHVSIPAREPQHVAKVLAELMNGKCFPFGPLEGAFMTTSGDANGTMIGQYRCSSLGAAWSRADSPYCLDQRNLEPVN